MDLIIKINTDTKTGKNELYHQLKPRKLCSINFQRTINLLSRTTKTRETIIVIKITFKSNVMQIHLVEKRKKDFIMRVWSRQLVHQVKRYKAISTNIMKMIKISPRRSKWVRFILRNKKSLIHLLVQWLIFRGLWWLDLLHLSRHLIRTRNKCIIILDLSWVVTLSENLTWAHQEDFNLPKFPIHNLNQIRYKNTINLLARNNFR